MEKINVKSLEQRGTMLIVGYTLSSLPGMPVAQATMNTGWQGQQIKFLMNQVGVGGFFEGTIVEKPNKTNPMKPYWNVTEINMNENFGKIATGGHEDWQGEAPVETTQMQAADPTKTAPNPQRVGLFIKLAVEMAVAAPMEGKTTEENLCENIQEIKKLEEFTIKLLG